MKILFILVIALIYYFGFYAKEPEIVEQQRLEPIPDLAPLPDSDKQKKQWSSDNVLQGYTDAKQKAKDMEQEMLKAAEKQRKTIDG